MFKQRSYEAELLDNLVLTGEELRKNLDEIEKVNFWLGGRKVFLKALQTVYRRYEQQFRNHTISLLDLGCGNGDLLRQACLWGQKQQCDIQAVGIDANPHTIAYAREKSLDYPQISYTVENIFSPEFADSGVDVVSMNLVCHHLTDNDLRQILENLVSKTRLAIIINDLHRHYLPYYIIKLLTRILPCSTLIKNDGPLSVLKSFTRIELLQLLGSIKTLRTNSFQLNWIWPFRWQVIIWCEQL